MAKNGGQNIWKYDSQTDKPYMWAEANSYYYRGKLVAKLKGGNVYTAPEIIILDDGNGKPVAPEPEGISLRPVDIDAMVAANRDMMEIIERTTVKKILDVYRVKTAYFLRLYKKYFNHISFIFNE
jgi:phosphoadenosine phosphosulfate reductase